IKVLQTSPLATWVRRLAANSILAQRQARGEGSGSAWKGRLDDLFLRLRAGDIRKAAQFTFGLVAEHACIRAGEEGGAVVAVVGEAGETNAHSQVKAPQFRVDQTRIVLCHGRLKTIAHRLGVFRTGVLEYYEELVTSVAGDDVVG